MSFIEGIGDEVTVFFVVFFVVVLATLVTFLENGSNVYNISPTHTSTESSVHTERNSTEEASSVRQRHPESTRSNSIDPTTRQLLDSAGVVYQQVASVVELSAESNAESSSEEGSASEQSVGAADVNSPTAPEEAEDSPPAMRQSDAEGIRVRLKYLDDTERTVTSSASIRIGEFKRNHFPEELNSNKVVRLIFSGHLLRDNATLESYRIADNSVLHVQVLQAQPAQSDAPLSPSSDLDLSHLFWPLMMSIMALCWILYINFPHYFNTMSLGIMCLFSVSLTYVWYSMRH